MKAKLIKKESIQHIDKRRKTKDNDEVWERRFQVMRMYAARLPIQRIANEFKVSRQTIEHDIFEYQMLMDALEMSGVKEEQAICDEVIRRAFNDYQTAAPKDKPAFLSRIIDAVKELAILKGHRKVEGTGNLSLTQVNISEAELDKTIREYARDLKEIKKL